MSSCCLNSTGYLALIMFLILMLVDRGLEAVAAGYTFLDTYKNFWHLYCSYNLSQLLLMSTLCLLIAFTLRMPYTVFGLPND